MCPIYDFKCDKCDSVEEKMTKSDVFGLSCECGGIKKRQISMPHVVLDGTDPSLPGAYDKWGRDREKRARDNAKRNG